MNTFYFNTGVKRENSKGMPGWVLSPNNVWQIPFECDAPKDAIFLYASPYGDSLGGTPFEIKQPCELISKYAYFQLRSKDEQTKT